MSSNSNFGWQLIWGKGSTGLEFLMFSFEKQLVCLYEYNKLDWFCIIRNWALMLFLLHHFTNVNWAPGLKAAVKHERNFSRYLCYIWCIFPLCFAISFRLKSRIKWLAFKSLLTVLLLLPSLYTLVKMLRDLMGESAMPWFVSNITWISLFKIPIWICC